MIDFSTLIPSAWRSSVMNLAHRIEADVSGSWNAAVARLQSEVATFHASYAQLTSGTTAATVAAHPSLATEYQLLHATGAAIRGAIRTMQSLLSDLSSVGLGQFPLIPIAALAIAIALITYWVDQAYVFNRRVSAISGLISQGVPAAEAAQIVAASAPQGVLSGLSSSMSSVLVIAGLGLAALIVVPRLIPRAR